MMNEKEITSIIQRFELTAKRFPKAIAFIEEKTGRSYSYSKLSELAERLSNVLQQIVEYPDKIEIGDETPLVAFLTERSLVSVVCILAILKARCAYVPVDPSFPADRQEYIFQHSKCQLALVDSANRSRIDEIRRVVPRIILLDNETGEIASSEELRDLDDKPADLSRFSLPPRTDKSLAYVLYTSGSTGKPKGD